MVHRFAQRCWHVETINERGRNRELVHVMPMMMRAAPTRLLFQGVDVRITDLGDHRRASMSQPRRDEDVSGLGRPREVSPK